MATKTTKSSEKAKEIKAIKGIPTNVDEDLNESPVFDVLIYREFFMELRRRVDELYEKREKSDKDYADYDEAIYSLIGNAVSNPGCQDFMGYCYKKGPYDFCIANYEKFMKWTILAAANGNAFSLSKLQIFLANSLENLLNLPNHDTLITFLDLTTENYYTLLNKLVCEEIVNILKITPENLIKLPEVYQEQNDTLLRIFDKAKDDATNIVKENISSAIKELEKEIEKIQEAEEQKRLKAQEEKQKQETKPAEVVEEIKEEKPTEVKEEIKKKLPAKKTPSRQKFRY